VRRVAARMGAGSGERFRAAGGATGTDARRAQKLG
jgi:hypothetical protein